MPHRVTYLGLYLLLLLSAPLLAQRDLSAPTDSKTVKAVKPAVQTDAWALSWWNKRHEEKLQQKESLGTVDLLMIGDSITHGWENKGRDVWTKYYADRNALNLGFSGDRTENVLWRLQNGEIDGIAPKLAVIMIGTNNTGHRSDPPEQIAAGVQAILSELQQRLPDTKVLLLAIFPRGADKNDPMRQNNDAANSLLSRMADGQRVVFLDVSQRFLDDDRSLPKDIMPDRLHPNERGYAIWAEAMEPAIRTLMSEGEVSHKLHQ